MNSKVDEISDPGRFALLEEEWNNLLSQSNCDIPFLRHEWFMNWWANFGGNNRMAVICVRRKGELVGAFPLMEIKEAFACLPLIILQSMTNLHSFRYHFIVKSGEDDTFQVFWHYLRHRQRRWDLLQLQYLPSDIPNYEALRQTAQNDCYRTGLWQGGESPYLCINGTWDEYWGTLKSKFRSNMRNRAKRLQQQGTVEHEIISNPADILDSLAEGFAIEQKSWKGEGGSAIACDPMIVNFYTRWAETAARKKWLVLSFLKVNGKRVAFDYSLAYQKCLYCMKIGYDPAFSPYSVGQLLCGHILQRCFEDGIIEYDFLGESSTQKSDWTSFSRRHVWLFVYNRTVSSRVHYIYKFLIKKRLKEWVSYEK